MSQKATRAELWTRRTPKAYKLEVERKVKQWEVKPAQRLHLAQQRWKELRQCESQAKAERPPYVRLAHECLAEVEHTLQVEQDRQAEVERDRLFEAE